MRTAFEMDTWSQTVSRQCILQNQTPSPFLTLFPQKPLLETWLMTGNTCRQAMVTKEDDLKVPHYHISVGPSRSFVLAESQAQKA